MSNLDGGVYYSLGNSLQLLNGTQTANQMLMSGSYSSPSWSTATYPSTVSQNQFLYASVDNVISVLSTIANSILSTDSSGNPIFSNTLPAGILNAITTVGTITGGTWKATAINPTYGGTGQTGYNVGDTLYASSTTNLTRLTGNTTATIQVLSQTGTGTASAPPQWVSPSSLGISSKAYDGTTMRSNAFPVFQSSTVASGTAVFNLTADGTSTGTPLFPTGPIANSINLTVFDPLASYQMSYAFSNSNKTITVTAFKYTTASLLTGILGQTPANGAAVKLSVWGY